MSKSIEYDEIIETNGVKVPFVPRIITPKIERPMRNNRYEGGECATLRDILIAGDRVLEFAIIAVAIWAALGPIGTADAHTLKG